MRARGVIRRAGTAVGPLVAAVLLAFAARPLAAAADVQFSTFTGVPDPVTAGEQLAFNLGLHNGGDATAANIVVDFFPPAGVTLAAGDLNCTAVATPSYHASCPFGDLAAGANSSNIVVMLDVAPSVAPGDLTIDGDVYWDGFAAPGNDGDDTFTVTTAADLTVTKTGPASATPGDGVALVYTIEIANAGPSDAANVGLSDDLAVLGTPTSVSGSGCTCSSLPCTLTSLAAGTTCTVTVSYAAMADDYHLDSGNPDPIVNTASVTTDTPDAGASDYSDDHSVDVTPEADLAVTIVDEPSDGTVTPGNYVRYRATVTNNGPSRVASLGLTGSSIQILSAVLEPEAGIFSAATTGENWTGLDLGDGDSVDLELSGWAYAGAAGTSFAVGLTVTPPPGVVDGTASNDTATDTDTIQRVADLSITKDDELTDVAPSQVVPYRIRVRNAGPSDVEDATVTDDFPSQVASASWTCAPARPLTVLESFTDGSGVDGLFGASRVAVSPDGEHVYVAAENDNSVAFFRRSVTTGSLTYVEVYRDGSGGVNGLAGARDVVVSPDGAHVYAVGEDDDAIAVFVRNTVAGPDFGRLDFSTFLQPAGLDGPVALAIAPDGRHLYVAGAISDSVTILTRDDGNGALSSPVNVTDAGSPAALDEPVALGVTFDGRRLLVLARQSKALNAFTRDLSTGALTHIETETDAVRLAGASGLGLAPDGRSAYASGSTGGYLVAFSVDLGTGSLNPIDFEQQGVDGVLGLGGASGVEVSPDAQMVVVHGTSSSRIAVFRRILTPADFGKVEFVDAVDQNATSAGSFSPGAEQLIALAAAQNGAAVLTVSGGGTCEAGAGTADLDETVDLPAGAYLDFTVDAALSGSASGTLVNTATVAAPAGVTDASTAHPPGVCGGVANNSCTDTDQIGLAANVSVTKSVTETAAIPGSTLHYTVVVENNGPGTLDALHPLSFADASLAGADFAAASWTCTPTHEALCSAPSGNGAIAANLVLPQDSSVQFAITATLVASATGVACTGGPGMCVVNQASATLPSGFVDPTPEDAAATVETPLRLEADLSVVKTVLTAAAGPGDPLQYQIVVANCGPSNVAGAQVADVFPADFLGATWTCAASAGSSCPAAGSGDIAASVSLLAGAPGTCAGAGTATFVVSGTVDSGAEGVLSNVASVTAPAGVIDATQGNNYSSANLVLTAAADVAIVKTDNRTAAVPGESVTYSIAVFNNGPDNVVSATVVDEFASILRDITWTCDSEAPALGTLTFVEAVFGGVATPDIAGVAGAAVSPDGAHLYAVGPDDDAIAAYARDAESGSLTFVGSLADGSGSINGLAGARAVAASADGLNLYVAAADDNAISVFTRNPTTGALGWVAAHLDGANGVEGLAGAAGVAVSPDGTHVYAVGAVDGAVAAFTRSVQTNGTLTFLDSWADGDTQGAETIDGLASAAAIAVSPDGAHVYVAGAVDDAVAAFRREGDGSLTFLDAWKDGEIQGSATIDGLDQARAVIVSPDGHHVYVAGGLDHAIAIFERDSDETSSDYGELTFLTFRAANESTPGPGGVPAALLGVASLAIPPDGEHLYAASSQSDAVVAFQRNPTTGTLKFVESRGDGAAGPCVPKPSSCLANGLDGAAAIAAAPDGAHVYVGGAGESAGALAVFERAPAPPAFAYIGGTPDVDSPAPVRDGDPAPLGGSVDGIDGASAIAVAGDFLYATGFADQAIAAFERRPSDGQLVFLGRWKDGEGSVDGLEGASDIAIFGDSVYVVSQSEILASNALVVFRRDLSTGLLTFVEVERQGQNGADGLFGAAGVAVSPDGRHVYVASRFPGAVAVFSRDTSTGAVAFVEKKQTGVGGVAGLQGAHGVAVTTDGKHVYVAASTDDAVVAFRRADDPASPATFGRLTPIQVLQDPEAGDPIPGATPAQGLDRAIGIAASGEIDALGSRNLYVTGFADDALFVLRRNVDPASAQFGRLSPVQVFVDGQEGVVDGLDGARAVRVSPDGKHVYVVGEDDDALAVFAREELGGSLVFVEAKRDGAGGIDGLDQAYDVAVSANNRYVYVAALGDDAVTAFARASGSRCTGSGVGDIADTVDIAAGGQVVYTVLATIDPAATGTLTNVATVSLPSAIGEPSPTPHEPGTCLDNLPGEDDNNLCRDVDSLEPETDLVLDKTDSRTVAIPGESLTYTLRVANDGPSNVVGARVQDNLSAIFPDGATWSCVAEPSGQLSFLAAVADGLVQPGPVTVDGLAGATGVAIAPDREHVYATGLLDDAVAIFAFDDATGALSYLDRVADGVGGLEGLDGAKAIVVSPDGAHVYATGQIDDTVLVFTREASGLLTLLQVVQFTGNPVSIPGATTVADLDQPVGLAFDPAGETLYVAAANSSSLVAFARNTDSGDVGNFGRLTHAGTVVDGFGGVDGLAGAAAVAVSPDPDGPGGPLPGGEHVYATGENENAVAVFARDAGTGVLSFLEVLRDGTGAIDGLAAARDVVVSPDGANVYVAGAADDAVAVFARATSGPTAGTLTFVEVERDGAGTTQGIAGAAALVASGDGFHVYVAGAAEDAIGVFRREILLSGRLTFVGVERQGFAGVEGLSGPAGLALSSDGRHLVAAGRLDDALAVFSRPVDSSCNSGSGTVLDDVVDIAAGAEIVYTITGLVAADACPPPYPCTDDDLVNTATVDPPPGTQETDLGDNTDVDQDDLSARADLRISKTDGHAAVVGLDGALGVAVSPDGLHVYAVGSIGDGVVAFVRDAGSGALGYVETERDGVAGVDGLNGASAVALDPDGDHVYVVGAADNAIAAFRRDAATGALTYLEREQNGIGGVSGLLGPRGVAVSADGDHVYVAGSASSSIAIFARDDDEGSPDFGKLTFLGEVRDGVGGVDGLGLVRALALVGEHLYAASEADSALAVFRRDAATGALTFVQALFEGVGGMSGLAGARGVAAAPGGQHLYVAAGSGGALTAFARQTDPGSPDYGKLTRLASWVDGVDGVGGLAGARRVVVAPDPPGGDPGGQHVYVASAADDAVAIFARDAGTGLLTFVAYAADGIDGVDGLDGASALAMAPDGRHLYVASLDDDAVSVLLRDWDSGSETGTGGLTFVEDHTEGSGSVAPGSPITYTITVENLGPSSIVGARVTDVFPDALESVSFVCQILTPGATCFDGSGDLIQDVDLPAGGSIRFLATGTLEADATGTVTNTATVAAPSGVIELDPTNNSSTDGDTVLGREADLRVDKIACTDPLDCDATATGDLVPGNPVFYQVRVTNQGPSDAHGVRVVDVVPESLIATSWTCAALPVPGLLPPPPLEVLTDGEVLLDPVSHPCGVTFTQVDGLEGPRGLAVAPDGLSLYVAGGAENAIGVFRRDLRNGELAFVRAIHDGDPVRDGSCATIGAVDGLGGATAVAVSPDGAHVYVSGEDDDAIVAFSRDALSGDVAYLSRLTDGQPGVNGLGNVRGLAISPDGAHVYTAASSDNGVGLFTRDAATGALAFTAIRVDGAVQGPLVLDGLAGASDVVVAPDGGSVYVAGFLDQGVAAFSRNAGSGLLTFVEAEKDGVGGADGLAGARALALSPDGLHLYVAASGEAAVAVFARDAATSALTFVEAEFEGANGVAGITGAAAVAVAPDGEHVYVAGASSSAVAVFARDPLSGELEYLGVAEDGVGGHEGLGGARGLALGPDGEEVYAVGESDDAVAVLPRQHGSRCTPAGFGNVDDVVDLFTGGTATYLISAFLAPSASGELVNVASLTLPGDVVDPAPGDENATHVGTLTPVVDLAISKDDGQTTAVPGLPITYTITVSNAGPSDLVGGLFSDLLPVALEEAAWTCSGTTGLAFVEAEVNGVGGTGGLDGGFAVALAPDPDGPLGPLPGGEHLYVASRNSNAIARFSRDPGTGELEFLGLVADGVDGIDGLGGAAGVALSPDSRHLYATGALDQAVVVFSRDPATGALTYVESQLESDPLVDGLEGAIGVAVSPDGRNVYVTGETDGALVVFARDKATGALSFVEREKDGFGGIPLQVLDGAVAVAVTPDGRQVLVAGAAYDTLVVFDRDALTGAVSLAEIHRDGVAGVDGLDLPQSIALSPGGRFIYVAGLADDAIAVFERDLVAGTLVYVGQAKDGVGGVDGLDGVRSLAVSADGQLLLAASYNDDAATVFRRDGATGLLLPDGLATDGVGGVDGLDGARAVAASPDGLHLYVVGEHDDAVAAFRRTGKAVCPASGAGDLAGTLDVAVDGVAVFTLTAIVDSAATGELTNEFCVAMPAGTTNLGATCATDTDTLTPQADLAIAKSNGVDAIVAGTGVVYTIAVENLGPSDAPGSLVTDLLPPEIAGASWACTPGGAASCPPAGSGDITATVSLPAGDGVLFALAASIPPEAVGSVTNTATVAPAAGVTDLVPGNNSSTDSDPIVHVADLAVTKTSDREIYDILDPIVFTVTVTNVGPSTALDVSVVDVMPAGVAAVAASGSGWSCTVDTAAEPDVVTCTVAELGLGAAPPIVIDAVASATPGVRINGAGASTAGSTDPLAANNVGTAVFEVRIIPPTVVLVDSVPTTADSEVTQMETVFADIGALVVEFSEAMYDPAGDGEAGDVTNPANYRLFAAGPDGLFAASVCGAPSGDDVAVAIAGVTYDDGPREAALGFAAGFTLPEGLYRFDVCDTVLDHTLVALDGDGDGTAGTSFVRFFRAQVDNLLVGSDFDFDEDLDAWTLTGGPGDISRDATYDWSGFSLSGSAEVRDLSGATLLALAQCVDSAASPGYSTFARVRYLQGGLNWGIRVVAAWYDGLLCSGNLLGTASSPIVNGVTPAAVVVHTYGLPEAPPGAVSVHVDFQLVRLTPAILESNFDDLGLLPPIFADGFETGDFDAWDGQLP